MEARPLRSENKVGDHWVTVVWTWGAGPEQGWKKEEMEAPGWL